MAGEPQQISIEPQHVINAQRSKIETMSHEIIMLEAFANQQAETIKQLQQMIADSSKDREVSHEAEAGAEESPADQAG